jgi:hypothetical protein
LASPRGEAFGLLLHASGVRELRPIEKRHLPRCCGGSARPADSLLKPILVCRRGTHAA